MKYLHLEKAIGEENVQLLQKKTVSIIGLGGIGSTIADLVIRAGINARIIEKGRVEEMDLDRLSLFDSTDVTKFKATQAKKHLSKINPDVTIKSFNEEITKDTLFLLDADLIIDCSANPELSELISSYAFKKGVPCITGEVRAGKVIVAYSNDKHGAYEQLAGVKDEKTEGLFPASTHMAAGFMFTKAVKILIGDKPKRGVVIYNVWEQCFEDKRGNKK